MTVQLPSVTGDFHGNRIPVLELHPPPPPRAPRIQATEPDRLVVAVWDADPTVPDAFKEGAPLAVPGQDAERGRGLQLVRACADSLGVSVLRERGTSTGGKLLWAVV